MEGRALDWSNASVDERGKLTVPLTGEGDNIWQQAFDATIYQSEGPGPDGAEGIVLAGDAITVSDVAEGSEAEVSEVPNKAVVQRTAAPQSGQKRNDHSSPSSEMRVYSVYRPWMSTRSVGHRACIPNALPIRRWQARQWHIEIRTGSPSVVTRG